MAEIKRRGAHMILSARNLYALFAKHKNIVNPFAAVCQCRHETSYQGLPWNSELCLKANNLAGVKRGKDWQGGVHTKKTWEQGSDGKRYDVVAEFRKYPDIEAFVADYATKIRRDYPLCSASADNLWGYFSGLFKGRLGSWATDLAYLERMIDKALELAPVFFGEAWEQKIYRAFDFALANNRLLPGHAGTISRRIADTAKKEAPARLSPLVAIDAGHGNPDPGAVSRDGLREADVVLVVAKATAEALQHKGCGVLMTRMESAALNSDKSLDLKRRVEMADAADVTCFVSIHANAAGNSEAHGIEVLKHPGDMTETLAESILSALVAATGLRNRGVKERTDLYVLRNTKMPAALAELAFLSNQAEAKLLGDPAWQKRAGEAIASGIVSYLEGA